MNNILNLQIAKRKSLILNVQVILRKLVKRDQAIFRQTNKRVFHKIHLQI